MNISKESLFLKTRSKSFGYILIILSAAFFALTHVIGKPLLGSGEIQINPVALTVAIYFINGLFFTPLARKSIPISKIGLKNLIIIAAIGIAEVSALIIYFYGLEDSTAINASIFSNGCNMFNVDVKW